MRRLFAKLPPSVIALLLQVAAVFLASLLLRTGGWAVAPLMFAVLCGGIAAGLTYAARLARWWLPIQFVFVPALYLALQTALPSWVYLAAFLMMLAVYWSTFRTQVPLYLSSRKVWQALEDLLPSSQADRRFSFMDLGSGLGGVQAHLSRVRPDGDYDGVEAAPLPFLWSWLRLRLRPNCRVQWGSLWDADLSRYDVVFAYLSPVPMADLWQKAQREMRPGSVFISSTFGVPEFPPQQQITVDDMHRSTLYVWRM
ncbi:MAG: class I SAM-dependent methyltransferase [Pseudomonadota bacterium]